MIHHRFYKKQWRRQRGDLVGLVPAQVVFKGGGGYHRVCAFMKYRSRTACSYSYSFAFIPLELKYDISYMPVNSGCLQFCRCFVVATYLYCMFYFLNNLPLTKIRLALNILCYIRLADCMQTC